MQLEGDYTFDGPRQAVWDLLQDPDVLQAAMPGAREFTKTDDDTYRAKMQVKVGPVNGVFDTTITLTDKEPPEQYTMNVNSQGPTGFARGQAVVTLAEDGPQTTQMHYDASLQVGGRIASVGQRMLDTVSKSLTRQSLEAMNGALQARLHAEHTPATDPEPGTAAEAAPPEAEAPAPPPTFTPPTQADFARGVAKDVAAETVRSPAFAWGLAAVALLILLLLVLFVL
ncbi:MAG: carbon monoxide dehydrogenase subunit G [Rhodothermales bacterium]|nr:carbon monoxide dehydrogenase subunit G [Rhodothermales bacterium]